ncbi:proline-rich protein 4-like isoform X1 [Cucurbita moschata]|uniref:Proline-rich protein 4-like isoform X1 n=1 Tax=Cucurbita moschata TaxID=3662 RepID=A0A6J1ERR1_CUCMO|nr:proline-rich protein 4-like isoform X1 [Cucurbita moschata]
MQSPSVCFLFWFFFLFAATFCHGSDLTTVEVVGVGECADCHKNNIKTTHAFTGLRVSVDCKLKDGSFERKGFAELNEEGKFKVLLPMEALKDGKLKGKCFAQLHSASSTPCSSPDGLESSMIVLKSNGNGKHTFGLSGALKFESGTCVSAFFWHYHHPPLPPIVFPPHPPLFGHPYFPPYHHKFFPPPTPEEPPVPEKPPPVYEPPPVPENPPPVNEKPPPVYEKPPPVYEKPPPVYKPKPKKPKKPKPPVYEPKPPVNEPKPPKPPKPPVNEPKPPKPPVNEPKPPKPPVYVPKPPTPVYKHPFYKILPPISKLPPCSPVPKVIPVIPPKYLSHPKFGKKFPPLHPPVPHP